MSADDRLSGWLKAAGLELVPEAPKRLLLFLDELLRWNRRINLTAIRDPDEGLEKHLFDSLIPLSVVTGGERLLDIGSGGGFPGIPLKIACPSLRIVSVDSSGKKIAFQKHAVRALGLKDFIPWQGRAEDFPKSSALESGFDLIISRAFSSIPSFVALALPCLAPGGLIVAMKGPEGPLELVAAESDLRASGVRIREIRHFKLPVTGGERTLCILSRRDDQGTEST